MYPHRRMPSRFVLVRARRSSSPTVIGSSPANRRQFDHIGMDTSQGAPGVRPWLVVECGICRSNSLSHSMMNATSTWESKADNGKRPVTAPVTVPVSPPVRVPVTLPVSAAGRGAGVEPVRRGLAGRAGCGGCPSRVALISMPRAGRRACRPAAGPSGPSGPGPAAGTRP